MTNSFFQTKMHPDDIHLTVVTTPFGLYKWLAKPMGLRNVPAIHQRRMVDALRPYLGKICHIYLDDIVIWLMTVDEHYMHCCLVMEALKKARLHCHPVKCKYFQLEIDFLGHHISQWGVEANKSKCEKILAWPQLKCSTDVRAFLRLVRYIAVYLPQLAEHTHVLTLLTSKEATVSFPVWLPKYQKAFENIKSLVTSCECLTVIDHEALGGVWGPC